MQESPSIQKKKTAFKQLMKGKKNTSERLEAMEIKSVSFKEFDARTACGWR